MIAQLRMDVCDVVMFATIRRRIFDIGFQGQFFTVSTV